ncbi:hypothetical protein [Rhodovulum euryhalinum]|uniref:hypothetical protein n=1 Tax=Rhodovulum euryhalinum TaxID=35805 RepID=UPI001042C4D7|nr:hypothetical protein [Rhodovulum euryhalinum]
MALVDMATSVTDTVLAAGLGPGAPAAVAIASDVCAMFGLPEAIGDGPGGRSGRPAQTGASH